MDAVLNIMESIGTKNYIKSLADKYSKSALKSFSSAKIDSEFVANFEELVQFLSTRNH